MGCGKMATCVHRFDGTDSVTVRGGDENIDHESAKQHQTVEGHFTRNVLEILKNTERCELGQISFKCAHSDKLESDIVNLRLEQCKVGGGIMWCVSFSAGDVRGMIQRGHAGADKRLLIAYIER